MRSIVAIISLFYLFSFSTLAQTAITFNGENQFMHMDRWSPSGKYRMVAWLGPFSDDSHQVTYLASNKDTNEYIAFDHRSVYALLDGEKIEITNKFDFKKTRYFEVTIDNGVLTASDGDSTAIVTNSNITAKDANYDLLYKRGEFTSKGALLSIGFLDLTNKSNSRTIAFDKEAKPVFISKKPISVELVNISNDDTIHGLSVPNPKVDIVAHAHELGDYIVEKYPAMPLLNLDLDEQDFGKIFAWQGYYWLRTYINLYIATRDTKYLDWAIELAQFMLNNTDDLNAARNELTKNPYDRAPREFIDDRTKFAPGWGEKHGYNGVHGVTVLNDGMILNGIMRLVDLIKTEDLKQYQIVANEFMTKSRTIVESHNSSWSETKQSSIAGSWYYTSTKVMPLSHDGLYTQPLPYNHSLTMATAMLLIDKWSGEIEEYRNKFRKLEAFFHDNMTFNADGSCEWNYAWYSPQRVQDVSHGHLEVGYFALAEREGYLVDDRIPRCMAKTVVEKIAIGPGVVPRYVNGQGVSPDGELFALSYDYRDLSKFESSIPARSNNILRAFINLHWFRQFSALSETFVPMLN